MIQLHFVTANFANLEYLRNCDGRHSAISPAKVASTACALLQNSRIWASKNLQMWQIQKVFHGFHFYWTDFESLKLLVLVRSLRLSRFSGFILLTVFLLEFVLLEMEELIPLENTLSFCQIKSEEHKLVLVSWKLISFVSNAILSRYHK